MQPVSPKIVAGKTVWKNEVWVMYQAHKVRNSKLQETNPKQIPNLKFEKLQKLLNPNKLKIISAWRYPGVSPEKNPIPQDILREIEEGDLKDG